MSAIFPALLRPYGLAVRTPPFHGGSPGSIPCRVANISPMIPHRWGFSSIFLTDFLTNDDMRLPEFLKEIKKGSVSVTIRVQNARQERALAGYEQTVLSAFVDVERGLTAYAREQIRGQSLTESVQANQKALNLAEDLYAHGLTDFLRVLVSERGLYQSQDALVQSDQAVALNLVALYKALGGGWEAAGTNLNRSVASK